MDEKIVVPFELDLKKTLKDIDNLSRTLNKLVKDNSVGLKEFSESLETNLKVTMTEVKKLSSAMKAIDAQYSGAKIRDRKLKGEILAAKDSDQDRAAALINAEFNRRMKQAQAAMKMLRLSALEESTRKNIENREKREAVLLQRKLDLHNALLESAGKYTKEVDMAMQKLTRAQRALERSVALQKAKTRIEKLHDIPEFRNLSAGASLAVDDLLERSSIIRRMNLAARSEILEKQLNKLRDNKIQVKEDEPSYINLEKARQQVLLKERELAAQIVRERSALLRDKAIEREKTEKLEKELRDKKIALELAQGAERHRLRKERAEDYMLLGRDLLDSKRAGNEKYRQAFRERAQFAREESLFGDGGKAFFGIQARLMAQFKLLAESYAGVTQIINQISSLDKELYQLQAISQTTNKDMLELRQTIIDVGESSKFSAAEIARAGTTLAQAGFSAQEIKASIGAVVQLATATGSTLAESVDLATSVMGVFNRRAEEMEQVANEVTAALNLTKLDVQKLALGLQYAGNIAAENKVPFIELTAIFGEMANSGVRSGSTLGTAVRQLLIDLSAPTEELSRKLASYGLTLNDVNVKTHGYIGVLKNLRNAGFSVSDAMETLEVRSAAGFAAIISNLEKIENLQLQLLKSGSVTKTAEKQMESFVNQIIRLGNTLASTVYLLAEPWGKALGSLANILNSVLGSMNNLTSTVQLFGTVVLTGVISATIKWVSTLTGLTAALGSLFATIGIGTATSQGFINIVNKFLALSSPLRIAIAGLASGIIVLFSNLGLLNTRMDNLNKELDENQSEVNSSIGRLDNYTRTLRSVEEEITSIAMKSARLTTETNEMSLAVETARSKFTSLGLQLDSNTNKVEDLINALSNLRDNLLKMQNAELIVNLDKLQNVKNTQTKIIENTVSEIKNMLQALSSIPGFKEVANLLESNTTDPYKITEVIMNLKALNLPSTGRPVKDEEIIKKILEEKVGRKLDPTTIRHARVYYPQIIKYLEEYKTQVSEKNLTEAQINTTTSNIRETAVVKQSASVFDRQKLAISRRIKELENSFVKGDIQGNRQKMESTKQILLEDLERMFEEEKQKAIDLGNTPEEAERYKAAFISKFNVIYNEMKSQIVSSINNYRKQTDSAEISTQKGKVELADSKIRLIRAKLSNIEKKPLSESDDNGKEEAYQEFSKLTKELEDVIIEKRDAEIAELKARALKENYTPEKVRIETDTIIEEAELELATARARALNIQEQLNKKFYDNSGIFIGRGKVEILNSKMRLLNAKLRNVEKKGPESKEFRDISTEMISTLEAKRDAQIEELKAIAEKKKYNAKELEIGIETIIEESKNEIETIKEKLKLKEQQFLDRSYQFEPLEPRKPAKDVVDLLNHKYRLAAEKIYAPVNLLKSEGEVLKFKSEVGAVPDFYSSILKKKLFAAETKALEENIKLDLEKLEELKEIVETSDKKINFLDSKIESLRKKRLAVGLDKAVGEDLEKQERKLLKERAYQLDIARKAQEQYDLVLEKNSQESKELEERTRDPKKIEFIEGMTASMDEWIQKQGAMFSLIENMVLSSNDLFNNLRDSIADMIQQFVTGTGKMSDAFKSFVNSILSDMLRIVSQTIANKTLAILFDGLISAFGPGIKDAMKSPQVNLQTGTSSGIPGKALGGPVRGGVPTRDSVVAKLMPGEFVMRKSAVDMIGENELKRMNATGKISSTKLKSIPISTGKPSVTNVWVVSQDKVPPPSKQDIIAIINQDIATGGPTKRLIRQVVTGT